VLATDTDARWGQRWDEVALPLKKLIALRRLKAADVAHEVTANRASGTNALERGVLDRGRGARVRARSQSGARYAGQDAGRGHLSPGRDAAGWEMSKGHDRDDRGLGRYPHR